MMVPTWLITALVISGVAAAVVGFIGSIVTVQHRSGRHREDQLSRWMADDRFRALVQRQMTARARLNDMPDSNIVARRMLKKEIFALEKRILNYRGGK